MRLIIKETFVTIKRSFKRFISIFLIVLLGVGFFAGIKATSPDMKLTINDYYKKTKFEDIYLMSTWGINENELASIKKEGFSAFGYNSIDAIVESNELEVAKIISFDDKFKFNDIVLLKGRLPKNNQECVIDNKSIHNHKIGEVINVQNDNLVNQKLKIVGMVRSPMYSSLERGSTNLLMGSINYFIYVPINNFKNDYYTNVGIYLNEDMFTKRYNTKVNDAKKSLEIITNRLKEERYLEEKTKALDEYDRAKKSFEKEKNNNTKKINDAKKKLKNAKNEYSNNLQILKNKKEELNITFEQAEKELNDNRALVINGLNEITITKDFMENNIITLEEQLELINEQINLLGNSEELVFQKENIITNLKELKEEYNNLLIKEKELNSNLILLNNSFDELLNNKSVYERELSNSKEQLDNAKKKIDVTEKELSSQEKKLKKELDKVEKKLSDNKKTIDELEKPEFYILDRDSNIGFYQFNQDVERIKNLGQVFPLVFFVVAVLICLTSMTRMVEEERIELGTLKSLGLTNSQILFKYILYALLATIVGSFIGLLIGFKILPSVIFNMYSSMYDIGVLIKEFNIYYALLSTGIALACTLLATIGVTIKSLREEPSELMRVKKQKNGKRILLEKIPFIWKRLDFNYKVTMRNLFRYKKRMLMTIAGVAGCTGLIIAGFGLRDCLSGMVTSQYDEVFKYDIEINLKNDTQDDGIIKTIKKLDNVKETARINKSSVDLISHKTKAQIQLVASLDNIDNFIGLRNRKNHKKLQTDKLIVSEKIANLLDLSVGENIKFKDDKTYNLKIGGITENYLNHYFYIDKNNYNSNKFNTILLNTKKINQGQLNDLIIKLKEIDNVSKVTKTSSTSKLFEDTMNNFEYVVIVLIVSANLLAFVVLYNLASVNISERKRELATIKVLGFYDKEVYDYIARETTILTFISIIFGLILGNVLTKFVIKTCELDIMMFNPEIKITSYIYGILLTILFTLIVNITTYFSLKKIQMVDSLKSVE